MMAAAAGTTAFLILDVWVFRSRFAETVFSIVTFCLPVDLVILFKPEWIDKYFEWFEGRKRLYRDGR